MGKLKARKPEVKEIKRVKMLLYGKEKVGKSFFSQGFPGVYYIDTEAGAVREQYQKKLLDSGGVYFGREEGSLDFKTVIEEVISLATEKHNFKTLVIDSFTKLYNTARAIAEEEFNMPINNFSADKKVANRPTKKLLLWIDKLDMNVILICHSLEKWEGEGQNRKVIGTTFDGWEKFNYELDLLIEAIKTGSHRKFMVKASRISQMPEGLLGDLEYLSFANAFGSEKLTKEQDVYIRATPEQVGVVQDINKKHDVSEKSQKEWLQKVGVEEWVEAPSESVQKYIDYYKQKDKQNAECQLG
jgi:hypothetical protein